MAITIDATVGGASANSFVTLAEWTTHMEGRLNSSDFDDETTDNKNRALAEATRELSAAEWIGRRVDETQALAWPRQLATDPDNPFADFYSTTVIPARLKRATYELAFEFLKAGTTDIVGRDTSLEIQRSNIGGAIETEYYGPGYRKMGLVRYPAVLREIGPLLAGSSLTAAVVRS